MLYKESWFWNFWILISVKEINCLKSDIGFKLSRFLSWEMKLDKKNRMSKH